MGNHSVNSPADGHFSISDERGYESRSREGVGMGQAKRGTLYLDAPTSYGAWIDECKERVKRGETQLRCAECGLWRWPGECEHDRSKMLTVRQFNAQAKAMEKKLRMSRTNAWTR